MTKPSDDHNPEEHGFAHPMPIWMLLAVFFALIVLTVLTVGLAGIEMGNFEIVTTLVIATIKASLVMMFFMHMKDDKLFNVIVFNSSFVFVALFIGLTLLDSQTYKDDLEPALPLLGDDAMLADEAPAIEAGDESGG